MWHSQPINNVEMIILKALAALSLVEVGVGFGRTRILPSSPRPSGSSVLCRLLSQVAYQSLLHCDQVILNA